MPLFNFRGIDTARLVYIKPTGTPIEPVYTRHQPLRAPPRDALYQRPAQRLHRNARAFLKETQDGRQKYRGMGVDRRDMRVAKPQRQTGGCEITGPPLVIWDGSDLPLKRTRLPDLTPTSIPLHSN